MKHFLYSIFFLLCIISTGTANAQTSDGIPYQAVARDTAGHLIAGQTISLRFTILQGSITGTVVYQETHTTTTNTLGLFTVYVTKGTSPGPFNPAQWEILATLGAYLKVEIDVTGGTAYVDMGTTQMLSVPFAMYAKIAGEVPGAVVYKGTWDAVSNTPALSSAAGTKGFYYVVSNAASSSSGNTMLSGIDDWNVGDWAIYNGNVWQKVDNSDSPVSAGGVSITPNGDIAATNVQDALVEVRDETDAKLSSKINRSGDTMTGDLILNADPASSMGAATKQYVDAGDATLQTQVSGKVNKAGDTMTGLLVLNADPVSSLGAATKQYVDAVSATKLNLSGGTMTGNLILHANPSTTMGAATKQYVDDAGAALETQVDGQFADLIDSYVHKTDDGVTVYLAPGATHKRFGIGDTAPSCPLGVKAQSGDDDKMICFTSADDSQKWNINLNPTGGDVDGFSIDDATTGVSQSRFFIDHVGQGNVGIGTVTPTAKLHVSGANDGGNVLIKLQNTMAINDGWSLAHVDDHIVSERNGAFSIFEQDTASAFHERITILPIKNVGINEVLPYATLHVSKPALDPTSDLSLAENTGILLLGPIDNKNLAFDSHQIQARSGEYVGSTLSILPSPLVVQPLGGDLVIHGSSVTATDQVIITNDGKIGVGNITPLEKIDIAGAIKIGTTVTANDGTIRYNGSDFQGRKSGAWVSLTGAGSFIPAGTGKISYDVPEAKVGIGVSVPVSALDVKDNTVIPTGDAVTAQFLSLSSSSAASTGNRVGVKITCSGTWSSSTEAKNIGIYVSSVSGQSSSSSNLAAVFNGNTVIGDLSSMPIVGDNGHRVLAIQSGTPPASPAGSALTGTGGIQLYSADLPGAGSTLHLMNGNGDIVKLYKTAALTAPNNTAVSSSYNTDVQNVINNMRDRINDLELRLQSLGLLATP